MNGGEDVSEQEECAEADRQTTDTKSTSLNKITVVRKHSKVRVDR